MRFHSIRLVDYRGISEAVVEFGDGVTVVEGPNEIGKSSFHEAIAQLKNDKASSRRSSVRDTQPVGSDVGPRVEVHLSTGDYELKYSKRWIRQPFTELSIIGPNPEQVSGDDAHDRFLALLDETVDVDLLVALDVAQGRSLAQAPLAEIRALHSALSESGVEPADHDSFLDCIEEEYSKFYTAKGARETGELKKSAAEVPLAEEAYEELVERSRAMDDLVESHARASSRLDAVAGQLEAAVEERDEAEQASSAVAELRSALEQSLERAAAAERDEQIARESVERRTALSADVDEAEKSMQAATEAAAALESVQNDKHVELEAAREALELRQEELETKRAEAKSANRGLARIRARTQIIELRQRLSNIRRQEERKSEAQATVSSIAVTGADIDHLSKLETDVRIAENAKTSAAAQVVVRRLGCEEIIVDGTAVDEGASAEFAVVRDLGISIDGIAEIRVRPGVSPAELDRAVTMAKTALDDELARFDLESTAQARERAAVRASAEAVLTEASSTLEVLLGEDDRDALEAALARAEHLVGESENTPTEASVDDLEATVAAADRESELAQSAVDIARTDLDRVRSAWDDARVDAVRAQAAQQETAASLDRLRSNLEAARSSASDEDLNESLQAGMKQRTTIDEQAAEARKRYEAADPETLEMRLDNARQLVDSKERQRESDRQEVDRLSALIDDRASEGIYDKLKAAEERMETAQATLTRLRRQAAAIRMLRETVLSHKEEAQRRYVAPFKEQIERLGRLVFGPGFSVEVSENLEIVSRTLDERTVPFDSLSGGTKEQLALIGRLAVAALVDERSGAPVILDDAFGFADAERLAALNVILGKVGQTTQVILLTCQPDRFATIGGATTVSLS